METPTKICTTCKGRKRKKVYSVDELSGISYPTFKECDTCDGDGYVYLTPEEIEMENDARRDHAKEF